MKLDRIVKANTRLLQIRTAVEIISWTIAPGPMAVRLSRIICDLRKRSLLQW